MVWRFALFSSFCFLTACSGPGCPGPEEGASTDGQWGHCEPAGQNIGRACGSASAQVLFSPPSPHLALTDPCLSRAAETARLREREREYMRVCPSVHLPIYQQWLGARTVCLRSHLIIFPYCPHVPPPPTSLCPSPAPPAWFLPVMHSVQLPFYCLFFFIFNRNQVPSEAL